jgi:acyl-CoA dehydrogenase
VDFNLPASVVELQQRVAAFIRTHVLPLEPRESDEEGLADDLLAGLRRLAREAGLWLPQLPAEYGGLGLDTTGMCALFEEAGYSPLGPLALNCAAPDEGNMHLLLRAATEAQRQKYLAPLARGAVRSCFALTEPAPGAGSDPTMIRTRATRQDGKWILDGQKWFTTGAFGAAFCIVAAISDPAVPVRQGVTLFLVDAGTPGFTVRRVIPTLTSGGQGGHCEVTFDRCAVSDEQVLGKLGEGFKLMQQRLGPARLTHCMRWMGAARRALDIAVPYAQERQAFGKRLLEHQGTAWALGDSLIELHAARLMVLHAAWKLDRGDEARVETSMCKVFVAETVSRVIDRAIQACGAAGLVRGNMLERLYRDVRAFRIYDGPSEVHRMVIARQLLRSEGEPRKHP